MAARIVGRVRICPATYASVLVTHGNDRRRLAALAEFAGVSTFDLLVESIISNEIYGADFANLAIGAFDGASIPGAAAILDGTAGASFDGVPAFDAAAAAGAVAEAQLDLATVFHTELPQGLDTVAVGTFLASAFFQQTGAEVMFLAGAAAFDAGAAPVLTVTLDPAADVAFDAPGISLAMSAVTELAAVAQFASDVTIQQVGALTITADFEAGVAFASSESTAEQGSVTTTADFAVGVQANIVPAPGFPVTLDAAAGAQFTSSEFTAEQGLFTTTADFAAGVQSDLAAAQDADSALEAAGEAQSDLVASAGAAVTLDAAGAAAFATAQSIEESGSADAQFMGEAQAAFVDALAVAASLDVATEAQFDLIAVGGSAVTADFVGASLFDAAATAEESGAFEASAEADAAVAFDVGELVGIEVGAVSAGVAELVSTPLPMTYFQGASSYISQLTLASNPNQKLIVFLINEAPSMLTSVRWGGAGGVEMAVVGYTDSGVRDEHVWIYELANPAAGTADLYWSADAAATYGVAAALIKGANQAEANNTVAQWTDNGSLSLPLTSSVNSIVLTASVNNGAGGGPIVSVQTGTVLTEIENVEFATGVTIATGDGDTHDYAPVYNNSTADHAGTAVEFLAAGSQSSLITWAAAATADFAYDVGGPSEAFVVDAIAAFDSAEVKDAPASEDGSVAASFDLAVAMATGAGDAASGASIAFAANTAASENAGDFLLDTKGDLLLETGGDLLLSTADGTGGLGVSGDVAAVGFAFETSVPTAQLDLSVVMGLGVPAFSAEVTGQTQRTVEAVGAGGFTIAANIVESGITGGPITDTTGAQIYDTAGVPLDDTIAGGGEGSASTTHDVDAVATFNVASTANEDIPPEANVKYLPNTVYTSIFNVEDEVSNFTPGDIIDGSQAMLIMDACRQLNGVQNTPLHIYSVTDLTLRRMSGYGQINWDTDDRNLCYNDVYGTGNGGYYAIKTSYGYVTIDENFMGRTKYDSGWDLVKMSEQNGALLTFKRSALLYGYDDVCDDAKDQGTVWDDCIVHAMMGWATEGLANVRDTYIDDCMWIQYQILNTNNDGGYPRRGGVAMKWQTGSSGGNIVHPCHCTDVIWAVYDTWHRSWNGGAWEDFRDFDADCTNCYICDLSHISPITTPSAPGPYAKGVPSGVTVLTGTNAEDMVRQRLQRFVTDHAAVYDAFVPFDWRAALRGTVPTLTNLGF